MYNELEKYKQKGSFILRPSDKLSAVCNVPSGLFSGIYLVYGLHAQSSVLIYIGISGKKNNDESIKHRTDGLRGRFLTGKTAGEARSTYWPKKMIADGFSSIRIDWYVTYDHENKDFPRELEVAFLKAYQQKYNKLPIWNKKV
jgi:hypothetical protein